MEYLDASYKEQMRIAEQSRGKDERQFDLSVDRVFQLEHIIKKYKELSGGTAKWWTPK